MIEATGEMVAAFIRAYAAADDGSVGVVLDDVAERAGVTAILAIVERDHFVIPKPTPEEIAARPQPRRRIKTCVENWPEAETGEYDPQCCRFPKSCSATVYPDGVSDDLLEPVARYTSPNPGPVDHG